MLRSEGVSLSVLTRRSRRAEVLPSEGGACLLLALALAPPLTAGLPKLGFESGLGLRFERPQLLDHSPLHAASDPQVAPRLYLRGELGAELFRHPEEALDLLAATFREPH